MLLVVLGNFIVLNLFLAILLGNFNDVTEGAAEPGAAAKASKSGAQLRAGAATSSSRRRMPHWAQDTYVSH